MSFVTNLPSISSRGLARRRVYCATACSTCIRRLFGGNSSDHQSEHHKQRQALKRVAFEDLFDVASVELKHAADNALILLRLHLHLFNANESRNG